LTISTYAQLESACENWLKRSGLDDRIPEFISLGEARIGREVKAKQMEQRVSTDASQYVSVPSDFVSMRGVRIQGSTIGWLDYMTPDEFFATTASSSSSTVKKYTIFGDELVFPVAPSGDVELWYYKRLAALSSATNTLFTSNPDLYLYAAMAVAQPFLQKDGKIALWNDLYIQVRDSVNAVERMGRYPVGMSVKVG
jgi:hypothetical protein